MARLLKRLSKFRPLIIDGKWLGDSGAGKRWDGVGRRVAAYRATAKLIQERLAEKIDVVPVTISRLERGVTVPSPKTLERIARALGVELKDLFDADSAKRSRKDEALDALMRDLKRRDASAIELIHELARVVFQHTAR